ncbi:GGDEF domain-containing protein [Oceanobacter mangrovi]|uniref:GGDEF domain-containing protein n=1 Tax=Oceanobacter mangrovi TaxID=2862510 RepID=UPI001C8E21BA|nr:GGDEF domain-containing protein [Oceanobacter mangrovi]
MLGALLYVAAGLVVDIWCNPEGISWQLWYPRLLALLVPATVALLIERELFDRHRDLLLALVGFAAGAGLIGVMSQLPVSQATYYYPLLVVITFYTYNFVGTSFIYALCVDLLLLAIYNLMFGWWQPFPLSTLISHNVVIICANLIAGAGGYMAEWQRRALFLHERELELERQDHMHRARHDSLTGLPNRELLQLRLERAQRLAGQNDLLHTVFFIDLDNFKVINDRYGHDQGDRLLQHIAEQLRSCCSEKDTIARIGGDEFVLLAWNVWTEPDIDKLIRCLQQAIATPMANGLFVESSIGCCHLTAGQLPIDDVLRMADATMYRMKHSRRVQAG